MAKQELWEVAKRGRGKPPAFESPMQMLERAEEYFQWCKDNPLIETKLFNFQGEVITGQAPLMRAMTQDGLCVFLNIGVSTWHDYKKKDNYSEVTAYIESVMREQKFSGAAAGLLKENIIARDLGLKDSSDVTHKGSINATVKQITHEMDPQEATRLYQDMINGSDSN